MNYEMQFRLNTRCGTKYSRMDQVKFFKGCLPQILLGPFLNIFSHMFHTDSADNKKMIIYKIIIIFQTHENLKSSS